MKRLQLFEIEDQPWCPRAIRDGITDYLAHGLALAKPYAAVIPNLAEALRRTGVKRVVDLCSGAGGPWPWLQPALAKEGLDISVCLTDRYPNTEALAQFNSTRDAAIQYHGDLVDATRVPAELTGFRTMFTAFHHFRPEQARAILADAVSKRQGIAVFEGMQRRVLDILLALLIPPMLLVITPTIRPFRWSRLFLTYLVPLIPAVLWFDATVSCLRAYTVEELREFTASLNSDYHWDIGILNRNTRGIPITYLIGVPPDKRS